MRVLLVNERGYRSHWMVHFIRSKDGVVDVARSLADMEEALASGLYDVMLVELDHGKDLVAAAIKSARHIAPQLRLLVLAPRESIRDVTEALDQGADDFILKPFAPEELRVRLHLLAGSPHERIVKSLQCGSLTFDLTTREVRIDGVGMELTPRERSVLQVLISHCGSVVSKEFIASRIFSYDDEAGLEIIEVYIHRLRRKLENCDISITTLRGLGYVLGPSIR